MVAPPTASVSVAGYFCFRSFHTGSLVVTEIPRHGAGQA